LNRKKASVPLGGENKRHIAHTEEASESNLHQIQNQSEEMEKGVLFHALVRERVPNHDKPRASEIETRRVRFGGFFLVARFDSARARFRRDTRARDAH
jgi:hypothetical protein